MAEYIDLEAILREIERRERLMVGDKTISVDALKRFLLNRPAADVAPVVHGRWIVRFDGPYNRRRCYCSHCGRHNGVGGIAQNQEKHYCPNCGAKMDGGNE